VARAAELSTPLLFALGFLTMFLIGGHQRRVQRRRPVDFALHDTVLGRGPPALRAVRRLGVRVIGGIYYWFPKMTGRMLNETIGKVEVRLMFIGFT
jgi:cytochrome c oxidase subunit 1